MSVTKATHSPLLEGLGGEATEVVLCSQENDLWKLARYGSKQHCMVAIYMGNGTVIATAVEILGIPVNSRASIHRTADVDGPVRSDQRCPCAATQPSADVDGSFDRSDFRG